MKPAFFSPVFEFRQPGVNGLGNGDSNIRQNAFLKPFGGFIGKRIHRKKIGNEEADMDIAAGMYQKIEAGQKMREAGVSGSFDDLVSGTGCRLYRGKAAKGKRRYGGYFL